MSRFALVMNRDADGYTKAAKGISAGWLPRLVDAGIIDQALADQLLARRHSLLTIRLEDLRIPPHWITEDPDFGTETAAAVKAGLRSGLTADDLAALSQVCEAMFAFVDMWMNGDQVSGEVEDENDLQRRLRDHLRSRGLKVEEGSVAGGGKIDLFVADCVLIESKWKDKAPASPATAAPAAGAQGRRYAVALRSQVVFTVAAVRVTKGAETPERTKLVEVRQPGTSDAGRVEIRFTVPYGPVMPSNEVKPAKAA